ncbi:subclass B1 metallo-beta-lactamase [Spirosoma sp. SC4-14]|uniref:subclass B1 metallo-beta-lactamase n=1 Tax=Spirosoma sp. SC4-14 TaxID=3128900 RepID=UPI0030CD8DE1
MKYLNLVLLLLGITQQLAAQSSINIERIAPSVYVHTSYKSLGGQPFPSNGLLVETRKGVVLIDTPWDTVQTLQLLDWVSTNLKKPVVLAIATHFHDDRLAGTEILRQHGAQVVATPLTAKLAKEEGNPVPDAVLPNDSTITVGGMRFETFFPGPGHAPDNIVVWLPKQKILFGGCLVKSVEATGIGNIADANLSQWPLAIQRIHERYPTIKMIVPGHQGWKTTESSIAIPFGHPALQRTLNLLERKGG